MVDISKVKYSVSVIGDDGTQYNIKNYIQGLGGKLKGNLHAPDVQGAER